MIKTGDLVEKIGGDYSFTGIAVAVFQKLNDGPVRVVVQNRQGLLHIFSPSQLKVVKS